MSTILPKIEGRVAAEKRDKTKRWKEKKTRRGKKKTNQGQIDKKRKVMGDYLKPSLQESKLLTIFFKI